MLAAGERELNGTVELRDAVGAADAEPRGEAEAEPWGGGAEAFVPGQGGHGGMLTITGKKHTLGIGTGARGPPQAVTTSEGDRLGDKVEIRPEVVAIAVSDALFEVGRGCIEVAIAVSDALFLGSVLLENVDDADGSELGVVDDESNEGTALNCALVEFDTKTIDGDGCSDPEEDTVGKSEY